MTTENTPTLTRDQWNRAYAARMVEVAKVSELDAMMLAIASGDAFDDNDSPADAADEEMSCWGD